MLAFLHIRLKCELIVVGRIILLFEENKVSFWQLECFTNMFLLIQ